MFLQKVGDRFFKIELLDSVIYKELSKLAQSCSVGNLFVEKVYFHKLVERLAIVNGILNTFIGKVKPILKKIHSQHGFNPSHWSAMFAAWIKRRNDRYPFIPRNYFIHHFKKFFSLCFLLFVAVLSIGETLMIIHFLDPFHLNYIILLFI